MARIYHECLVHGESNGDRWADCDLIYEYKHKGEFRYRGYALRLEINYEYGATPVEEYYMSEVSESKAGMLQWFKVDYVGALQTRFYPDDWEEVYKHNVKRLPRIVRKRFKEVEPLLRMML